MANILHIMIRIILMVFLIFQFYQSKSQILFTESFSVILNASRTIQGSITPNIEFQTQKENLFEFEAMADISFRVGRNALTFANETELTRFGGETILSGIYLYGEYRIAADKFFYRNFMPRFTGPKRAGWKENMQQVPMPGSG